MKLFESGAQMSTVEVDIQFCSGEGFMAQKFLYAPKIGATFKKVGCERMPQCMWRYLSFDTGQLRQIADNIKNHHPSELPPSAVEEKNVRCFRRYI